jgi:HSP20 family molecular chaperone IbpA
MNACTEKSRVKYIAPRVNILDRAETVVVEAELPGVPKDGVTIQVENGEMVLTGRRGQAEPEGTLHIHERPRADYQRTFALSKAIDSTRIEAAMRDGLLTVTLHKADEVKPRTIAVN